MMSSRIRGPCSRAVATYNLASDPWPSSVGCGHDYPYGWAKDTTPSASLWSIVAVDSGPRSAWKS